MNTYPMPELTPEIDQYRDQVDLQQLWNFLCDSYEDTYSTDGESPFEQFEGYLGLDQGNEMLIILGLFSDAVVYPEVASNEDPKLAFSYSLIADSDGVIGAYEVGVYVRPLDCYVMDFLDLKDCTVNRDATGQAAALAYAVAIYLAYHRMHEVASRLV